MNNQYIVSPAPHIRSRETTKRIMWSVALAILPIGIIGAWIFGAHSLYLIITAVLTAVVVETAIQKLMRRPVSINDGSAVITGLLLAYNLPPHAPLWLSACGAFFAIAIVKHAFGGLGKNIFNPALAGRAFLMLSWPSHMTAWVNPRFWPDSISSATPLAKNVAAGASHASTYWDLFIGNRAGCIGEVCIAAILCAAAFLLWRGYLKWRIPLAYIFTVAFFTWVFGKQGLFGGDWLFSILAGGLMLGAFFMATDMVTSPVTKKGQLIFGAGCGILTFVIRKWGGYPEGVSYSILMMNAAVPIIERFTKPRVFGKRR